MLFANEVQSPLLYSANKAPFRVRDAVGTLEDVGGPYLAIALCEGMPDGSAQATTAFAVPVLSGRRFIPVRTDIDRDVLRAIERLQIALDAHGTDCVVQRIRPHSPSSVTVLNLSLASPDGRARHFRIAVDPAGLTPGARHCTEATDFVVSWQTWKDGRFVAWLEKSLIA